MKKLISIFLVSFLLVFLCIPTFAESQIVDGYAIDNVPYSSLFDGVLTASDSGSQLYSSSENRTYNTSSILTAPATSSQSVYYFKSIIDFIPWNIWRGSNSPVITNPQKDGYTGVKYVWNSNPPNQNFYHYNSMSAFVNLRPTRKYRISFTFTLSRTNGTFQFYLADQSTPDVAILYLLKVSGYNGNAGYIASTNAKYTIEFTMPNDNVKIVPVVKGTLAPTGSSYSGVETEFYINDFTIIDITTEDLDNSIDKGVQKIEDAGSDEPPLDTDISAFSSAIDTMNGWLDQLNEFADSIDSAGDTAKDYISKGTEMFNGFMSVAPASVIALIAFGVVFLVIRKIVGR